MFSDYIRTAMRRAKYEFIREDAAWYGKIPGFRGVYAYAPKLRDCRKQLEEVLEGWILLRISKRLPVPVIHGIDLNIHKVA